MANTAVTAVPALDAMAARPPSAAPVVLCAGIAVLDFIFRMERFPDPATKVPTEEIVITGGGCAANAAIAVARLGGRARFCGPLGDDEMSARILRGLAGEGVDIAGVVKVAGAAASVSGIFIDGRGERLLTTRRAQGLSTASCPDPDRLLQGVEVLLADNHYAEFVEPICRAGARRNIPVVLDLDKPMAAGHPLFGYGSHVIFSAEVLRAIAGTLDWAAALARVAEFCPGFVAVTDGANGMFWREGGVVRHQPAYAVAAVDTLAAGDVFHGAFALACAEGREPGHCLRFAAAAAALKCTRFGGIAGAPRRAEVERFLAGTEAER